MQTTGAEVLLNNSLEVSAYVDLKGLTFEDLEAKYQKAKIGGAIFYYELLEDDTVGIIAGLSLEEDVIYIYTRNNRR